MTGVRWDRVDALIDSASGLDDLRVHGLHLLAARRWRATGRPVPPELAAEEVGVAWRVHSAAAHLAEIRRICSGPLLLVKGPAVSALYPDPAARPFVDIDLLVPDPHIVQQALLDAGFRLAADPAEFPDDLHHLPPIHSPPDGPPIEVHSRLKWVEVLPAPTFQALCSGADDSALGVDGIMTPSRAKHALLLTGHLWAHDPLTRLLRLLDIAVVADGVPSEEIDATAAEWDMARLWRTTRATYEALFGSGTERPWPLRTWARALPAAREPTVAEVHAGRLLSPFSAYPPAQAGRALRLAVAGFLRPQDGEPWRRKLRRTARQVTRPGMRRSEHLDELRSDSGHSRQR